MIDDINKHYPEPGLPDVDYALCQEDKLAFHLTDLEYQAFTDIQAFLVSLESALSETRIMQIPELIVAHLGCYLGAIMAVFKADNAVGLVSKLTNVIQEHAQYAFSKFNQYPVNDDIKTQYQKSHHFEQLRDHSPGSIAVQTVRLGRIVMDILERLSEQRSDRSNNVSTPQDELLCPQNTLFAFLIPLLNKQHHQWQTVLKPHSIHYAINQLGIQIAWLIGYFAHLDSQQPDKGQYLNYALTSLSAFQEQTHQLLELMLSEKGQVLTSMQYLYEQQEHPSDDVIADELKTRLSDVHELSQSVHAQCPPAITPFQKQTVKVQADLEKQVIELLMENRSVKIMMMSLFHFWFTLDAPLRVSDPTALDEACTFDEHDAIIALIKTTVHSLPDPELSPELIALNTKMQALKSNAPDPETLDNVSQDHVTDDTAIINTTLHSAISDYLAQDVHIEIIANVLFSLWLRFSVFFGVPEQEWQKMDYYFPQIIDKVRQYLSSTLSEKYSIPH